MTGLTPAQKLAELLHDLKCERDHCEQCCWGYIKDRWTDPRYAADHGYPFKQYLDSANRILEITSYDSALAFLSAEYGPKLVADSIRRLGL